MIEKPAPSGMRPEGQAPEGTGEPGTSRRFALIALALAIVAAGSLPGPSSFPALVLAALAVTLGISGLSQSLAESRGRSIAVASLVLGVSALVLPFLAATTPSEWADPTAIALAGLGVVLGIFGHRRTESRWILSLVVGAAVLIALGSVPGLGDAAPLLLGLAAIVLGILGLRSRGTRGIAILALVLGLLLVAFLVYFWIAWANCC